jgi:hypothetical protein
MPERKNSRVDNGNASRFNPAALVAAMFQRIPSAHTQSCRASRRNRNSKIVPRPVGCSTGEFRLSATRPSINKGRDSTWNICTGREIKQHERTMDCCYISHLLVNFQSWIDLRRKIITFRQAACLAQPDEKRATG